MPCPATCFDAGLVASGGVTAAIILSSRTIVYLCFGMQRRAFTLLLGHSACPASTARVGSENRELRLRAATLTALLTAALQRHEPGSHTVDIGREALERLHRVPSRNHWPSSSTSKDPITSSLGMNRASHRSSRTKHSRRTPAYRSAHTSLLSSDIPRFQMVTLTSMMLPLPKMVPASAEESFLPNRR